VSGEFANPHRGEASLAIRGEPRLIRPSFAALTAAEEELGALFALVERAAAGQLRMAEMVALFWHCLANRDGISRDDIGEAIARVGLAEAAKPLRALLAQILQGTG
jgi:hypothetical protein